MTTNKPEVVAYHHINKENPEQRGVSLFHDPSCTNTLIQSEPLIRLSDYEALQAECEQLLIGLPDSLPMEPYQTVDRGSPHYKAGWNACRRAMLAAAPDVQGEPVATIHVDGSFVHVAWRNPAPSRCAMDVYTAPQPTPDVSALVEALGELSTAWRELQSENDGVYQDAIAALSAYRERQGGEA